MAGRSPRAAGTALSSCGTWARGRPQGSAGRRDSATKGGSPMRLRLLRWGAAVLMVALPGRLAPTPPAVAQPPRQPPLERAALRGHTEVVYGVAFSPDGKTLASGGG